MQRSIMTLITSYFSLAELQTSLCLNRHATTGFRNGDKYTMLRHGGILLKGGVNRPCAENEYLDHDLIYSN